VASEPAKSATPATAAALAISAVPMPVPVPVPGADAPVPDRLSLAVLPFANMSGDASQEFFADGITEEIIAALSKVADLRVVGRTSAFHFKGKSEDLRSIGHMLNAAHLIEGSVRKAGDRLRITAQLVRADTGVHIWSESYDREFNDIFAIQEDIARAIATALRVPLGLAANELLVPNRTTDLRTYEEYLRALQWIRVRLPDRAVEILQPICARNPHFSPAWAMLGYAYALQSLIFSPSIARALQTQSVATVRTQVEGFRAKAAQAARRATELDPRGALGFMTLGSLEYYRGNWVRAAELLGQARSLDVDDADLGAEYCLYLGTVGKLQEASRYCEQLLKLDPLHPSLNYARVVLLLPTGRADDCRQLAEALPVHSGASYWRNTLLARLQAMEGRYDDAASTLLRVGPDEVFGPDLVRSAADIVRSAPSTFQSHANSVQLYCDLAWVYGFVGAHERAMDYYEKLLQSGVLASLTQIWEPHLAAMRRTPRFKQYLRDCGLVDYWRVHGWPPMCRPVGSDDFVCD
jgi:TolB-like protein/Tfp pilus assembly protein PilF